MADVPVDGRRVVVRVRVRRLVCPTRGCPRYQDLGPGYYESRIKKQRRQRDLIRQLEHLTGQKVHLQPQPGLPAAA